MKRQDIISKLMNEGFSQKTLVGLNDKQLHMLAERILSEQYSTTPTQGNAPVNISKADTGGISKLKQERKQFVAYEGEVKEEKLGDEKKTEKSEKDIVLQRINHRIETKMKKNDSIKIEVELLKTMGEKIPEKVKKYCDTNKETKKEKVSEPVSENKKIKKWVNNLIEAKCFTSKNDILKLIQVKLSEQKTKEAPQIAEPDIKIEPDKRQAPGIDPDDPFRDPHPNIDPNPKAGGKDMEISKDEPDVESEPGMEKNVISAEDAKKKIIALLKSKL